MSIITDEWLIENLSKLLAAPHIHFPPSSIIGGPGPVDLFSTYFDGIFTKDVSGTVNGSPTDREGIKQALLAIQRVWNPKNAKFVAETSFIPEQALVSATWSPGDLTVLYDFRAGAIGNETEGTLKITSFHLTKDDSLMPNDPPKESDPDIATDEWLIKNLSKLLAAPHIHFENPSHFTGHGPIDLFSTIFENLFTDDASGTINGQSADREAIKDALLQIQKQWNPDSAQFTPDTSVGIPEQAVVNVTWTPKGIQILLEFRAGAMARKEGGLLKIFGFHLTAGAPLLGV